eukprot:COSAG02_NODE_65887_length_257_cov_0.512658_1_plen_47_part_10
MAGKTHSSRVEAAASCQAPASRLPAFPRPAGSGSDGDGERPTSICTW